jgi:uncharacterized protein DUF4256
VRPARKTAGHSLRQRPGATSRHFLAWCIERQSSWCANAEKLWSLSEMERTGGEPDVIGHDKKTGEYIFYDCSAESPKDRRSVCYAGSRPVANLRSFRWQPQCRALYQTPVAAWFIKDSRSLRYPVDLCKNLEWNHPVFAFSVAPRFAAPLVSLPPYQFARDRLAGVAIDSFVVYGNEVETLQDWSPLDTGVKKVSSRIALDAESGKNQRTLLYEALNVALQKLAPGEGGNSKVLIVIGEGNNAGGAISIRKSQSWQRPPMSSVLHYSSPIITSWEGAWDI